MSELSSRPESVALAERLAFEARGAEEPVRARALFERAASLREHLFRRDHQAIDALEAIDLWQAAAKKPGASCSPALRGVLLDGETRREPAATYGRLYALKLGERDPVCRGRVDRALLALEAYRPPASTLTAIERASGLASGPKPSIGVDTPREEPPRIERIERYGADDAARLVMFVSRPVRFESGRIEGPNGKPRLFVDLEGASYAGKSAYDVGGLVEKLHVGRGEQGTRVLLELKRPVEPRLFYLPEPFRVVVDLLASTEVKADAPRAVRRVVLDPGHGGRDPGATGPNGLREKDVALDIAHRAAPILAHELGITTLLTRDGDHFVPLDERSARANAFHADLFLSIHCNATDDGIANGVTSFVLDRGREDVATRLLARENAAPATAASELAAVFNATSDASLILASSRFASLLQRAARASLEESYPDVPDGGVQRAGFYVLAGARMPAVLLEASFISNTSGAARLSAADFRQKIADAIVNAVRAYGEGR